MIICEHLNAFVMRREQVSNHFDSLDIMLFSPEHSNTSIHILHTVLRRFLKFADKGNFLIRTSVVVDHFLNSCDLNVGFRGVVLKRN